MSDKHYILTQYPGHPEAKYLYFGDASLEHIIAHIPKYPTYKFIALCENPQAYGLVSGANIVSDTVNTYNAFYFGMRKTLVMLYRTHGNFIDAIRERAYRPTKPEDIADCLKEEKRPIAYLAIANYIAGTGGDALYHAIGFLAGVLPEAIMYSLYKEAASWIRRELYDLH